MSEHLVVESGETYTISSGSTEEYIRADIDGTLEVDGTLKLIDDAEPPATGDSPEPFDLGTRPINLPLGLDLPVRPLNLLSMEIGLSLFLMGLLSLLLGAAAFLKNYAAGVAWGFAIVALLMSGLIGIGLELFWMLVVATVLLLVMGWIVRWGA